MGCIQTYFRRAATGSSQTSPSDIVKHIVEHERSKTSSETSRVPPVSQEPTSMCSNGVQVSESEIAERGSLHCVEATAVRTLAASTGTVAILGTTAKCNESIDYRYSVHSEHALSLETRDEMSVTQREELESSEKKLAPEADITTPSDIVESTDIVTTAIIEVPPDGVRTDRYELLSKSEIDSIPENHLPKVIDSIVKQSASTISSSKDIESEPKTIRESSTEMNESSEVGSSSSEVISIVKQDSREDDFIKDRRISTEVNRPNRLSFGQYSIESDQNTTEISSADDVKNESMDITSPESLRESMDESPLVSSSSKKSNVKEISNTSLNTLGDDSDEDNSDLEADFGSGSVGKREKSMVKRFDTISSNGESSYRLEEPNYASVSEEVGLDEFMAQSQGISDDGVFENDSQHYVDNVRDIAANEVDRICKEAIEKMTDVLMLEPNAGEGYNVSESSVLSAIDSTIAEKGSDFDTLSFLDEPSDSRSVSMFGDGIKSSRSETENEPLTRMASPKNGAQKFSFDEETLPISVAEETTVTLQDDFESVIVAKNELQSMSEDLPRPPDLDDLPPLPENFDQYDITEEELKAVALPENIQSTKPGFDAAASKIQAGVRGYLTRKQIKDLKNDKNGDYKADTFDTELLRNYTKSKRLSLDSKLVDIENIRKLPKLNAILPECTEEGEIMDLDKAATKIQNTYKNYRARKSICLGDPKSSEKNTQLENSDNRGKKNVYNLMDEKFELEESKPLVEGAYPSAHEAREGEKVEEDDDSIEQAVVKIQATYRGFRTRKSIQVSTTAATKIQAHFRGYKVRKSMKKSSSLNDLPANSNSSSCSNLSGNQHLDLEKHATKIQAGVRGYLVRKRHSLQNSAATKIQLNYRRYKSRKMSLANAQTYKPDV